jgi:dTDP-4-dehydrorhamnose 3,5-epimerase
MEVERTKLEGCLIIHDTVFNDDRGYFFESYNQKKFADATGLNVQFVQDNQSRSTRGVLRGLHFQLGEHAQAKLVRVLRGVVIDVAVDIRRSSPTFGQYVSVLLSENSHTQFFIPRGFAHGFAVISEQADFFYKCDNLYNKASEGGIIYNDPALNIDWQLQPGEEIVSSKDLELPTLSESKILF